MSSSSGSHNRAPHFTMLNGCPFAHNKNTLTAGPQGPALLQDIVEMEKLGQFDREKIPARNVHALGDGAHGTFTVTHDISQYCFASLFSSVGKQTPIFCRLSGVFTEQGDPDTTRDVRGLAVKFYTEQGNLDLTCTNFPVFITREAKLGPDAIHAFKRDPRTGQWFPTQTWDFIDKHPEGLHSALMLWSDCGTPLSYRHQHYYACNTYSFINADNVRSWVKFHFVSEKPKRGLSRQDAALLAGEDPNWFSRDLRESIQRGDFPRWRLAVQVMPENLGYQHPWTFDATKVWPHTQFPLIPIGTLELNRNVIDYFTEVEQAAFSPANVVSGISFSPDKLLQGRLFIYWDTQHHRLGPNFKSLPINAPRGVPPNSYNPYHALGGQGQLHAHDKFPHYYPSNYGKSEPDERLLEPPMRASGPAGYFDLPNEGTDADYYEQSRIFYRSVLDDTGRSHLIENLAASLARVIDSSLVMRIIGHLSAIEPKLGDSVKQLWRQKSDGRGELTPGEQAWRDLKSLLCEKGQPPTQMQEGQQQQQQQEGEQVIGKMNIRRGPVNTTRLG